MKDTNSAFSSSVPRPKGRLGGSSVVLLRDSLPPASVAPSSHAAARATATTRASSAPCTAMSVLRTARTRVSRE